MNCAKGEGSSIHRAQACFAGGMLALGSVTNPSEPRAEEYMETGAGVTETCHWAYNRTATGIGPEYIQIDKQRDFSVPSRGKHYLLRPGSNCLPFCEAAACGAAARVSLFIATFIGCSSSRDL